MSWLERDLTTPLPPSVEWRKNLADIHVSAVPFAHPAIDVLLKTIGLTHVNGGAFFGTFTLSPNPTLDILFSHDRAADVLDRAPILKSGAVFDSFPKLKRDPASLCEIAWEEIPSLAFAGQLANSIKFGGAYTIHKVSSPQAHEIAENFRIALFDDRFDDILVLRSGVPWNGWFHAIAWDATWFILDKRLQRFSLLLMTDTD